MAHHTPKTKMLKRMKQRQRKKKIKGREIWNGYSYQKTKG